MPSNEQEFVDFVLDTVSKDVKKLGDMSSDLLDSLDHHVNLVAESLRDVLHSSPWIPVQIKPVQPPTPSARVTAVHDGYLSALVAWMSRHRAVTAAAFAFVGTGAFLMWRQQRLYRRARRARRAASGAKTEVVVLAGSPYARLTRSVAVDLDRKGFLVFIPVTSEEEEAAIAEFQSADVRPLSLNITSDAWSSELLDRFSAFLENPQRHGTKRLHLASLVLLEAYLSAHPTESIYKLSAQQWSDSLNTHVLYPISLVNTFLPLLCSGQQHEDRKQPPTSVVLITASAALAPQLPGHATESLACTSLHSYIKSLQVELPPSCQTAHIRLGAVELDASANEFKDPVRRKWANMYQKQGSRGARNDPSKEVMKYSSRSLRDIHNAVFDTVSGRTYGTIFVGKGARTYALVGSFAPNGLVAWMQGLRSETGKSSRPVSTTERTHTKSNSNSSSDNDSVGRSLEWEKVPEA